MKIHAEGTGNFITDISNFPIVLEKMRHVFTHEIRKLEEIYNIKALLLSQEEITVLLDVNKYSYYRLHSD